MISSRKDTTSFKKTKIANPYYTSKDKYFNKYFGHPTLNAI